MMLRKLYLLVFVSCLSVVILEPCCAVTRAVSTRAPALSTSLRSAKLLRSLNKQVKLKGYYYDGSIPMIVDDMDLVRAKAPLPPSSYVPIVGGVPSSIRSGDRITISGTLFKPGSGDDESIKAESAAVRIVAASGVTLVNSAKRLNVQALSMAAVAPSAPAPGRYALLMGGGYDPASERIAFRNGILATRQLLLSKGYAPGNIYVLYGNGYTVPGGGLNPAAPFTKASINTAFNMLSAKVKDTDTLYIMVSASGGGMLTSPSGPYPAGMLGGLVDTNGDENDTSNPRVDETFWVWPKQPMSDDEFRFQVSKVQHYAKMIIEMDQAFSGGFIRDLTGPRRMIIASVGANQLSWNEPSGQWDSFTVWWLGAFQGHRPWSSTPVPADLLAPVDGKISIVEAYNAARMRELPPNTAGYEDNGVPPGWNAPMPYGGDGVLGKTTFL